MSIRIEVTSKGAVVTPINDYKIVNASGLSSSWEWAHFATSHTMHNRASNNVCKMCYDFSDKQGKIIKKNLLKLNISW